MIIPQVTAVQVEQNWTVGLVLLLVVLAATAVIGMITRRRWKAADKLALQDWLGTEICRDHHADTAAGGPERRTDTGT